MRCPYEASSEAHSAPPAYPRPMRTCSGAQRALALVASTAFALLALALASCGGTYGGGSGPPPRPPTPGQARFAYLYSRLDYPLQVAVNSGDTVTLQLSPQSNILSVTPGPGRGSGTVGSPIPLPTDL